jgi:hypothetical protein
MHGDSKALICGTAVARPCQYLVGKLYGYPTCWSSSYLGRIQTGFPGAYIPDGVLHMKQEEFMKLKQGGDTVTQYLNKFNHLSQYAIDQVNTDLKKKNCFMRGLSDRLQRKMATCLDLTYSRAVSTALSVEAKYAGPGKSKGYGGDRPNQGPEKRQRLVIRPFNQNRSSPCPPSYRFKQPVCIRPATAPTSTTQPVSLVLNSLLSQALQQAALIVESPDILSRTVHTRSKANQIISRVQGVSLKAREMRRTIPRAKI